MSIFSRHNHKPCDSALAPIAGVTLEVYVRVVRGVAAYRYDPSKLPLVAEAYGVGGQRWSVASAGWSERIRSIDEVGARYSQLSSF